MPAMRLERRWLVLVFTIVYVAFTYGLVAGGFAFWVGPWGHDFKVPRSLIMSVYTAATLVMVLSAPLVGRALDFLSVRAMLAIGALVMTTGLVLAALAPSFWLLLAIYATIIPFGAAFAGQLPAVVLNVRLFPGRTGLINGLMSLALALSAVVMAAFSSTLIGLVGWRGTFLIAAGVMLGVVTPIGWLLMNVEAGAPARTMKREASEGAVSVEGFDALRQPMFWVLVLATLPIMLTLGALPPNLAAIAVDSGVDSTHAALLVSTFALGAAAGCLVGGWLVDRLPPRTFYAGVFLVTLSTMVVMAQRPSFVAMVPMLGLVGLAGGSMMPWVGSTVMSCFGAEGFARVIGLLTPFFIPTTFAPILFGWIRDKTGGDQAAFLVFAALLAPGGACLFLMRPAPKPSLVPAE